MRACACGAGRRTCGWMAVPCCCYIIIIISSSSSNHNKNDNDDAKTIMQGRMRARTDVDTRTRIRARAFAATVVCCRCGKGIKYAGMLGPFPPEARAPVPPVHCAQGAWPGRRARYHVPASARSRPCKRAITSLQAHDHVPASERSRPCKRAITSPNILTPPVPGGARPKLAGERERERECVCVCV